MESQAENTLLTFPGKLDCASAGYPFCATSNPSARAIKITPPLLMSNSSAFRVPTFRSHKAAPWLCDDWTTRKTLLCRLRCDCAP
jgi:hypothetical protein